MMQRRSTLKYTASRGKNRDREYSENFARWYQDSGFSTPTSLPISFLRRQLLWRI